MTGTLLRDLIPILKANSLLNFSSCTLNENLHVTHTHKVKNERKRTDRRMGAGGRTEGGAYKEKERRKNAQKKKEWYKRQQEEKQDKAKGERKAEVRIRQM